MKNKTVSNIILVIMIYISAFIIVSPSKSMEAAQKSLLLCGNVVIPSLFPFIFCTNTFIALGAARLLGRYTERIMQPTFGVSGVGSTALVLGVLSGYPIGAVCTSALYQNGECSKSEAEKLLAFCNNSGPVFIIGSVGIGMLNNHKIGIVLYLIHIISSFVCGVMLKNFGEKEINNALYPSKSEESISELSSGIAEALNKSVDTILKICGFVIVFSVFTSVLPDTSYKKYIYAFIEITGGINEICASESINKLSLALISAFLSLSGVSVFAQVSSIVCPVGLSLKNYVLGKVIQAVLSFFGTLLFFTIFPLSLSTFSYNEAYALYPLNFDFHMNNSIVAILFALGLVLISALISKLSDRK